MFTVRTLRSLRQAQPAQSAAVAADAGGAGGTGVERYGPYHQRQRERQIQPTGHVHIHLQAERASLNKHEKGKKTFLSELEPVLPVHVNEIQPLR